MRRVNLLVVGFIILAPSAFAQAATIAVFNAAATNPNTNVPVAPPVTYTVPLCDQPTFAETPPITNPTDGYYTDPAKPLRTCTLNLRTQFGALPVATGYRSALKLGTGPYGAFGTSFAVAAQAAHPCDTTPTSPAVVDLGASFTLGWCHPSLDTNGATTTVTSWRVYRNNVLVTATVTAGATANAAGLKFYTTSRSEAAAGLATFEVSAVNTIGEGARSPLGSLSVVQPLPPPSVPVAPSRGRITIP